MNYYPYNLKDEDIKIFAKSDNPELKSIAYWWVGHHERLWEIFGLSSNSIWKETCTKIFLNALKCNRNNVYAYYSIGCNMQVDNYMYIFGKRCTKIEVLLEALKDPKSCDEFKSDVYYALAKAILYNGDSLVALPDGRCMNQTQLYLESIKYNVDNMKSYIYLMSEMGNTNIITIYIII